MFGRGQKQWALRGRKRYIAVGVFTNKSEVLVAFATSQKGDLELSLVQISGKCRK